MWPQAVMSHCRRCGPPPSPQSNCLHWFPPPPLLEACVLFHYQATPLIFTHANEHTQPHCSNSEFNQPVVRIPYMHIIGEGSWVNFDLMTHFSPDICALPIIFFVPVG